MLCWARLGWAILLCCLGCALMEYLVLSQQAQIVDLEIFMPRATPCWLCSEMSIHAVFVYGTICMNSMYITTFHEYHLQTPKHGKNDSCQSQGV